MPTPSNNQAPSIAEVISTRTCPPDLDRIPSWDHSPDAVDTTDALEEDVLSPAIPPSVLSRSDDGTSLLATDPLRVERKMASPDEETGPPRSTSPTDSCARLQSQSQSLVAPSNSSLLRYEFSNVRVCGFLFFFRPHSTLRPKGPSTVLIATNSWPNNSSCRIIHRPFFVPEADLSVPNSQTVRCTMWTWRLSTWT